MCGVTAIRPRVEGQGVGEGSMGGGLGAGCFGLCAISSLLLSPRPQPAELSLAKGLLSVMGGKRSTGLWPSPNMCWCFAGALLAFQVGLPGGASNGAEHRGPHPCSVCHAAQPHGQVRVVCNCWAAAGPSAGFHTITSKTGGWMKGGHARHMYPHSGGYSHTIP